MNSRKKISMLGVGLVLASVAIASPALADDSGTFPTGCSVKPSAPSLVAKKKIAFGGSASCRYASSADFRLVHNYDKLPDARVKNVNIRNNGTNNFAYTGATCDNGGTKQYYSEIHLQTPGDGQRVSKTVTLSPC